MGADMGRFSAAGPVRWDAGMRRAALVDMGSAATDGKGHREEGPKGCVPLWD